MQGTRTGPPNGGEADEPPHPKGALAVPPRGCEVMRFQAEFDGRRGQFKGVSGLRNGKTEALSRVFFDVSGSPVFAPEVGRVLRLLPKKRGRLGRTIRARRSHGFRTDAGHRVRATVVPVARLHRTRETRSVETLTACCRAGGHDHSRHHSQRIEVPRASPAQKRLGERAAFLGAHSGRHVSMLPIPAVFCGS